jgi:hypothetical protein
VSRKTNNHQADGMAGLRGRAALAARQTVPMAKTAVPAAGVAARQGAQNAATWATPHVHHARAWTAPRLERSAQAVVDELAPRLSDALMAAARKIDTNPPKRRRWPMIAAGTAIVAAGASAATAIVLRNRPNSNGYSPDDTAASNGGSTTGAQSADATEPAAEGEDDQPAS